MSKRERIEDLGVALEKVRILVEDMEIFELFKKSAPIDMFGNALEEFDQRYLDRQNRYFLYLSLYGVFSQLDSVYSLLKGDSTLW